MALCRPCHAKATLDPAACGERYLQAWRAWRDWLCLPTGAGARPEASVEPEAESDSPGS
jgi:hypothetical protein